MRFAMIAAALLALCLVGCGGPQRVDNGAAAKLQRAIERQNSLTRQLRDAGQDNLAELSATNARELGELRQDLTALEIHVLATLFGRDYVSSVVQAAAANATHTDDEASSKGW